MASFGRGAKVLMVALFVSVCVLLHLELRVTTLMSEADDARFLAEAAMRERDRMKLQTRNHEREVLKVIDSEVPRREPEDKEYDTLRTTRTATVAPSGHEETQIMSEKFKYHFKAQNGVKELWWHLRARLRKMKEAGNVHDIDTLLNDMSHHEKTILVDLDKLGNITTDREWRENAAKHLGDLMQRRLHRLQNPKDCSSARKLVCSLSKACGFGCQMHHAMYCFIVAYGTERTLILQSGGWSYSQEKGWEGAFLPVSTTCTTVHSSARRWDSSHESAQVVSVPIIESISPRPPQLPQAIPRDLADMLFTFHGHPFVWFAAQFLKYLMRPNSELSAFYQKKREAMNIKKPYVGVQVRRTDKVNTEAAFHGIEEYMEHVEEWYQKLSLTQTVEQRRVYIATDEPSVITETKTKYPQYEVYGDIDGAKTGQLGARYSISSLFNVAADIQLLAESDYLVCTFSSQVCRMGYEIMQTYHVDASQKYYSLDDIYYFGGQQGHDVRAVYSQKPRHNGQVAMDVGDLLGIAGNEKDGTSKGKHRKTNKYGEYYSYLVEEVPIVTDFPTYPGI